MLSKWITVPLLLECLLQLLTLNEVGSSPVTPRNTQRKRLLCSFKHRGGANLEEDEYGASKILLQKSGSNSSIELMADRFPPDRTLCATRVQAAPTHMLSLLLVPFESPRDFLQSTHEDLSVPHDPCPLTVYLGNVEGPLRKPLLTVDLCNADTAASALLYVESLPHTVIIEWSPPESRESLVVASSIVLTSIGIGVRECTHSRGMVPCFNRSRQPTLCVATELVCDGRRNCPMEGDDEDPILCSNHGGEPITGQGKPAAQDDLSISGALNILENLISNASSTKHSTEKPFGHQRPDGDAPTLAKYGTWGYLLLAMLACGGLLTMCGLWECCCRQAKVSPSSQPHHSPTTVLIINQEQQPQPPVHTTPLSLEESRHSATPEPPAYDDLDQPPAYGTLFPAFIKVDDVDDAQLESSARADSPETTQSA